MEVTVPRVLVACDEPLTRWAVEQALSPRGCHVTAVATRGRACEELFGAHFDVLVMAETLDGEDMTELCRQVSAASRGTRLIVLSDPDNSGAVRAQLPAALVLEQPYSLDDLMAGVP